MGIELTALHWVYLLFIVLIIGVMVMRRDTSFICIAGIFVLGLLGTGSLVKSISGIFNSFIFAISELLGTILIISIIVAMSKILTKIGVNEMMVSPFTKLIRNPTLAYWVIGILMMVISWFFWPSPAVALLGAVLLPVAVKVGLPPIAVAMAMNLFGHGIALSGDFIIQGAPKLTAGGAGIPVGEVVAASVPLVIVMGVVTTVTAFIMMKRDMKNGTLKVGASDLSQIENPEALAKNKMILSETSTKILAIIVPLLFVADVVIMYTSKLQGGDATALIGGTAVFILVVMTLFAYKDKGLEEMTAYLIEGFQFGFKVFGPVIPIAAFFYLGDSGFIKIFGDILPINSQGLVNDLGVALAKGVPLSPAVGGVTMTVVGTITGLDGSGFSGISLAGSVAKLFSIGIGSGIATMTALGQIAAIWVGGGTLIPWALIPAAAICGVSPFELARRNLIPVIVGLAVTTVVAVFLI
ncbi:MAG: rane protein [Clostridiales bacterium]|jgi:TRAP-type C4-dicarboxylate transport system permease large subunit|nr:rane protein [Clostridiales bacterium]